MIAYFGILEKPFHFISIMYDIGNPFIHCSLFIHINKLICLIVADLFVDESYVPIMLLHKLTLIIATEGVTSRFLL